MVGGSYWFYHMVSWQMLPGGKGDALATTNLHPRSFKLSKGDAKERYTFTSYMVSMVSLLYGFIVILPGGGRASKMLSINT